MNLNLNISYIHNKNNKENILYKFFVKNIILILYFNTTILSKTALWTQSKIMPINSTKENIDDRIEKILDLYGNNILRLAYSYLHNMSDSEEILQDTLLQFIKKAPDFQSSDHEKAWLFRVAANLSKNRIKYNKIRSADELNENLISEKKKDLSFIWEAVKSLPEKYREAIHLFYYEGYSTDIISKILNRNESTIRSDLHRGRQQLKKILKGDFDFE